jgi:hypothetical protein
MKRLIILQRLFTVSRILIYIITPVAYVLISILTYRWMDPAGFWEIVGWLLNWHVQWGILIYLLVTLHHYLAYLYITTKYKDKD